MVEARYDVAFHSSLGVGVFDAIARHSEAHCAIIFSTFIRDMRTARV